MSTSIRVGVVAVIAIIGSSISIAAIADPYVDCNNPRTPSYYAKCKIPANDAVSKWTPTSKAVKPTAPLLIKNPRHPAFKRS